MDINFEKLSKHIGVEFNDISLLRTACTHRSFLNENRGSGMEHNERLEFLGDAVLELVVTSFLFRKFPRKPEGELTAYRSALVNTVSLTNAVEAVIGSIYLDQGYNSSANFISEHLLNVIDIDEIIEKKLWLDAKSRFQERSQEKVGVTPSYKTLKEVGPDHDKQFTLGVFLGDVQVAIGSGPSKQEAEQKAAEKALEVKKW